MTHIPKTGIDKHKHIAKKRISRMAKSDLAGRYVQNVHTRISTSLVSDMIRPGGDLDRQESIVRDFYNQTVRTPVTSKKTVTATTQQPAQVQYSAPKPKPQQQVTRQSFKPAQLKATRQVRPQARKASVSQRQKPAFSNPMVTLRGPQLQYR